MARPTKLTPEVQNRLVDAIRAGSFIEAACAYAGVTSRTYHNWMERGEQTSSGPYRQLFDAISAAEGQVEVRLVTFWMKEASENWQAARDFLARRFPERWAPRERREHSGHMQLGGPSDRAIPITLTFDHPELNDGGSGE